MKSRVLHSVHHDRLKIHLQIPPVPSQPKLQSIGLTCSPEDCRFRTYRPMHWTAMRRRQRRLGPMLDLNDLFYFVQIVDRGGFTAPGRSLAMPKSTLSYRMQQLEAALGVRLLNRTSRHFGPTQPGEEVSRPPLPMGGAAAEGESPAR